MDETHFRRVIALAGDYHDEAIRCADGRAFHAACVMIGSALEAALLVMAAIFEQELRGQGLWPRRKGGLENWSLDDLIGLAREAGWLPSRGEGVVGSTLDEDELGEAVEFVKWLRNFAVHPGRHIREGAELRLGEVAYRNAYGILRATFDETYHVLGRVN